MLVELGTGEPLLRPLHSTRQEVCAQREARIALVVSKTGSSLLGQVARGLLQLDPTQRLSGEDMLSMLQTPASPTAGGLPSPHAPPAAAGGLPREASRLLLPGQQEAQAPARVEEEPARQEEGVRARRETVQGVRQAPVAVPAQPQLEGLLRRKNPAAGFFADKYKTVCSCRLLDEGIRVQQVGAAETLYDLADWHLLPQENLDRFSLSTETLQKRSDPSCKVTFKAASAAEAQMWIAAIEKTPQERGRREEEEEKRRRSQKFLSSLQVCR